MRAVLIDEKGWRKEIEVQDHGPSDYLIPVLPRVSVSRMTKEGCFISSEKSYSIRFVRVGRDGLDRIVYVQE